MLTNQFVTSGTWLFRWRSYLPLALAPLLFWASRDGEVIEHGVSPLLGEAIEAIAILLVVLGQALRIATVGFVPRGTSGRNTAQGQVAERLNTTGVYSLVRNPLYLANCTMYVGLVLFSQHLWLVAVVIPVLALYYERIIAAEEAFLLQRFGQDYADWAARTPAFWPRLHGWQAPDMTFSLRTVLRREHASIFGAVLALYLVELGLHSLPDTPETMPMVWHGVLAVAVVLELAALIIKRYTRLLEVQGR